MYPWYNVMRRALHPCSTFPMPITSSVRRKKIRNPDWRTCYHIPQDTWPVFLHTAKVMNKRNNVESSWCGSVGWALPPNQEVPVVQFPFGAHAWVADLVPGWGCLRGNQLMCLSHDVSLPLFLSPFPLLKTNKIFKKKKKQEQLRNCHRPEETGDTWQQMHVVPWSDWVLELKDDISGKIGETLRKSGV